MRSAPFTCASLSLSEQVGEVDNLGRWKPPHSILGARRDRRWMKVVYPRQYMCAFAATSRIFVSTAKSITLSQKRQRTHP